MLSESIKEGTTTDQRHYLALYSESYQAAQTSILLFLYSDLRYKLL